jgi:TRAP-type C4-dicarboxylate transport system substrate-binding protein
MMHRLFVLGFIFIVTGSSSYAARDIKAASMSPNGTLWAKMQNQWAEQVKERSKGELNLQMFPGGVLGNEADILKKTRQGRIQLASISNAVLTTIMPEISLMGIPYFFDSAEEVDCVRNSDFGKGLMDRLEKHGLKFLNGGEVGWVYLFGKADFSDPKDLDGVRMFAYPNATAKILNDAFGIVGVTMPFADVASALQTGLIDGGGSPMIAFLAFGFYETAPHVTKINILHVGGSLVANKEFWDSLSKEEQDILSSSGTDPDQVRQQVRDMIGKMEASYIKKGGPVHIPTPEQIAAHKAKFESVKDQYLEALGPDAKALYPDLVEARKVCRQQLAQK